MKTPILAAVCALSLLARPISAAAPARPAGSVRFALKTPGGPLPFRVAVEQSPGGARVRVINGPEILTPRVIVSPETAAGVGRYVVRFDGFGSELEWTTDQDGRVGGQWRTHRRGGVVAVPLVPVPPRADPDAPLFDLPGETPRVASGRYRVVFSSSDEPAVGVFEIARDGSASGTFLTTTGDYRYLTGNCSGDTLRLSCFDGAHAFLFHAERRPDGTLAGDFWSGNWWHETWTATPDPDARLPDPFARTRVTGGASDLESLVFRDLEGEPTPVARVAPPGTPRVVMIFGSWCPNCHDETRLLTELHAEYAPRGLRIAGLAFEHDKDFDAAAARVRAYAADLGVGFPLLLAGLSQKDKASKALPVLDRVRSYPTTLFINADGRIEAVYTGFRGPATGDDYTELRRAFIGHIESMLGPGTAGPGEGADN